VFFVHIPSSYNVVVDAEHPNTTPTTQAPSGPMTRAHTRGIQSEVTSLLLELPLHMNETWLLPQSEISCMIRYNEHPEDPRAKGEQRDMSAHSLSSPEPPTLATPDDARGVPTLC
jgi:hypothetical protein